jgi:hypothetical protein
MTGKVYFAKTRDRIKVGFSTNVRSRISTLNTSSAEPIELLTTLDGDMALEKSIHEKLSVERIKGEWFRDSTAVRALIAELTGFDFSKRAEQPLPSLPAEARTEDEKDDPTELHLLQLYERFRALIKYFAHDDLAAWRRAERDCGVTRGTLGNLAQKLDRDRYQLVLASLGMNWGNFRRHLEEFSACDGASAERHAASAWAYLCLFERHVALIVGQEIANRLLTQASGAPSCAPEAADKNNDRDNPGNGVSGL